MGIKYLLNVWAARSLHGEWGASRCEEHCQKLTPIKNVSSQIVVFEAQFNFFSFMEKMEKSCSILEMFIF